MFLTGAAPSSGPLVVVLTDEAAEAGAAAEPPTYLRSRRQNLQSQPSYGKETHAGMIALRPGSTSARLELDRETGAGGLAGPDGLAAAPPGFPV